RDQETSKYTKCDNCHHCIKDNSTIRDIIPDIEELLRIIELEEFYDHQDFKKLRKPKLLSIVELAEFMLQDLIRRVIEGLADGAKEIIKEQE
ncbi:6861_t:CDS:2, partial [Dentiscutata heterogama]